MDARATVVFHGRVQGVNFRGWAQGRARELGLRGWVRNEGDGTVAAVAEGPRAAVEEWVRACREEQPRARVNRVDVRWSQATDEYPGFTIEY